MNITEENVSKLTSKFQATIPQKVRESLGLGKGDVIGFEISPKGKVTLYKIQPIDRAYLKTLDQTLTEWGSKEDAELFKNW